MADDGRYMTTYTVNAGATSDAILLQKGAILTVTSGATVQYTKDGYIGVANRTATWSTLVLTNSRAYSNGNYLIKVTAATVTTVTVNDSPSAAQLDSFSPDFLGFDALSGQFYTYATLPPASSVAAGTTAWTTDLGMMISDGISSWVSVGSVTSVNGDTGPAVVLDAADVGAAGTASNTYTGPQQIDSTEPRYLFNEIDQAANEKLWDIYVSGKTLGIRTRTDADGAGVDILKVIRGTGTAVTKIELNSSTSSYIEVLGTQQFFAQKFFGSTEVGGAFMYAQSTVPRFVLNETGSPADEQFTEMRCDAGLFTMFADSSLGARNFLSFDRTGGAVTVMNFGNATDNPSYTFLGTSTPGHGSTTLARTTVALANGAAAAAGTLLNSPTAGDPTKWVPINDNGTTRYIPTWT